MRSRTYHRTMIAKLTLIALLGVLGDAATWTCQAQAAKSPAASSRATESRPPLDIKEIRLDNGLRIFVYEKTTSPTFAGLYLFGVGGAMDPKGRSGIAHLLEHMMFKGTRTLGSLDIEREEKLMARVSELWHELHRELDREKDPFGGADREKIEALRREIDKVTAEQKDLIVRDEFSELMSQAGGTGLNASTGNDVTRYYLQLPANRLEFWFRIESERLLNPVFREFYAERDVVQEERRLRYETSPGGMMFEGQKALLFNAHPYATPVIGWPGDLQRLTVEDARDYFRTYYSPSNCIMVLVGDLKAAEVERLARKYFSAWQRQTIPRLQITNEPEQTGERRRVVEFDAEPRISVAWPSVAEGHKDQYALEILARVLGGLQSSRMDRTIVQEERIAASVGSSQVSLKHAGYFTVSGTPTGGHTSAELEAAMDREIKRIQETGVAGPELERAKIQTEVGRVSALKSNMGLASLIGEAVRISGGTAYIQGYEQRINAVTAEEVQGAAKSYLKSSRKNVIELRKTSGGAKPSRGGDVPERRDAGESAKGKQHSPGFETLKAMLREAPPLEFKVPTVGKEVDRVVLPSGVTVFIKEDHSAPSIELGFSWLGGSNTTPVERLAPFEVADDLLSEGGTESLDPMALSERTEELGMSIGFFMNVTGSGGSFWSLKRTFPEAFALATEAIKKPRLDEKRLTTIKGQYIESMRRRYESPGIGASLIVDHIIDGDHPRLGHVVSRQEIEAISPAQVRAIWETYTGRDNLYVAAVGDFDKARMLEQIERAFAGWRTAKDKNRVWITRDPVSRPGVYMVDKDLQQVAVRFAEHLKIDRRAPEEDHAALEIMDDILGGSGFSSRLMQRLRTDEGLTYGVSSFVGHEGRPGVPGALGVSYQTKQATVARSVDVVMQEIRRIIGEDVTPAEVAEQIDAWRNRFVFRFTNDFSVVNRLMALELDDRPYDKDSRDLAAVQKVTVKDVRRVAETYLKPSALTLAIYGTITDADRSALEQKMELKRLKREEVFKGGYDEAPAAGTKPATGAAGTAKPADEPSSRPQAPKPSSGAGPAQQPEGKPPASPAGVAPETKPGAAAVPPAWSRMLHRAA